MVVYFSMNGNTKLYAEILADLLKDKAFCLEEKNPRVGLFGMAKGLFQSFTNMAEEVKQLPDVSKEKIIYICSPTWASSIVPAIRFFIRNTDLTKKTVNVVLTCNTYNESYKKSVFQELYAKKCNMGFVHCFASDPKAPTDAETIRDHLKKIVLNIDATK